MTPGKGGNKAANLSMRQKPRRDPALLREGEEGQEKGGKWTSVPMKTIPFCTRETNFP